MLKDQGNINGVVINLHARDEINKLLDSFTRETFPSVKVAYTDNIKSLIKGDQNDWLQYTRKKIEDLAQEDIHDPLGSKVYLAPGRGETVEEYAKHLIAGLNKPLENSTLSRAIGCQFLDKTLKKTMAILVQESGRKVYLSMYDLSEIEGAKSSGMAVVVF